MLNQLVRRLFADEPSDTLYHYTTFKGFLGIVDSGVLWASDVRYMNDSAELRHAADLMHAEVSRLIAALHPNPTLLNHLMDWLNYRLSNGHMVFTASFRVNGNLLSQWRGYSSVGKGVSLGFKPDYILRCARQQNFQVGRCIYDPAQQRQVISDIIHEVELIAAQHPEYAANGYAHLFQAIESDLLSIASILKHPSFQEEEEWRIVSPPITDFMSTTVSFREGTSMLVPYIRFQLQPVDNRCIPLEHVFLGPTPNANISMNSMLMYLKKHRIEPLRGVDYCQIPYREQQRF